MIAVKAGARHKQLFPIASLALVHFGSMEQIGMHSLENACVLPLAPRKLHGAVGMQWLVTFGGKVEAHPTLAWHQLALDAQAAGVAR